MGTSKIAPTPTHKLFKGCRYCYSPRQMPQDHDYCIQSEQSRCIRSIYEAPE